MLHLPSSTSLGIIVHGHSLRQQAPNNRVTASNKEHRLNPPQPRDVGDKNAVVTRLCTAHRTGEGGWQRGSRRDHAPDMRRRRLGETVVRTPCLAWVKRRRRRRHFLLTRRHARAEHLLELESKSTSSGCGCGCACSTAVLPHGLFFLVGGVAWPAVIVVVVEHDDGGSQRAVIGHCRRGRRRRLRCHRFRRLLQDCRRRRQFPTVVTWRWCGGENYKRTIIL